VDLLTIVNSGDNSPIPEVYTPLETARFIVSRETINRAAGGLPFFNEKVENMIASA
jgi:hypothetical protein